MTHGAKPTKPAAERARERGLNVIGATALKTEEPMHGDGDEGGGDESKLTVADRLEVMTLAANCYSAVMQAGDENTIIVPEPKFNHPVKLAEAMRAWIEDGETL